MHLQELVLRMSFCEQKAIKLEPQNIVNVATSERTAQFNIESTQTHRGRVYTNQIKLPIAYVALINVDVYMLFKKYNFANRALKLSVPCR